MVSKLLRVPLLFLRVGLLGLRDWVCRALMEERLEREEVLLLRLNLWPRRPKFERTSFFNCPHLSDWRRDERNCLE